MLTQAGLKELLTYNPATGEFRWVKSTSNRALAGAFAGGDNGNGYLRVHIDGRKYFHHRLAWLWVHGSIPSDHELDHIDGNPKNNAIINLRVVTRSENEMNKCVRRDNATGATGIYRKGRAGKFVAEITAAGRRYRLGPFSDFTAALAARREVQAILHGEFGRTA